MNYFLFSYGWGAFSSPHPLNPIGLGDHAHHPRSRVDGDHCEAASATRGLGGVRIATVGHAEPLIDPRPAATIRIARVSRCMRTALWTASRPNRFPTGLFGLQSAILAIATLLGATRGRGGGSHLLPRPCRTRE